MKEKLHSKRVRLVRQDKINEDLQAELETAQRNQEIESHIHRVALKGKDQLISSLKEKLNRVATKNETLNANLEDCKERIFKMQPFEAKSDAEIAALYTSLVETVTTFVADLFDRLEDADTIANGTATTTAVAAYMQGQSNGYADRMMALMGPNPSADEIMLASVIARSLYIDVLSSNGLCCGVDQGSKDFMYGIMIGLSQLEPTKGEP